MHLHLAYLLSSCNPHPFMAALPSSLFSVPLCPYMSVHVRTCPYMSVHVRVRCAFDVPGLLL